MLKLVAASLSGVAGRGRALPAGEEMHFLVVVDLVVFKVVAAAVDGRSPQIHLQQGRVSSMRTLTRSE